MRIFGLDFDKKKDSETPFNFQAYLNSLGKPEDALRNDREVAAALENATDEKMVLGTLNLVKKYGKRTVANHVSIEVTQGEIVGLLGPNGAGKTTTSVSYTHLTLPTT